MSENYYIALNGGKRIACPDCGEDRASELRILHDGGDGVRCGWCGHVNPIPAFRVAGALPVVVQ